MVPGQREARGGERGLFVDHQITATATPQLLWLEQMGTDAARRIWQCCATVERIVLGIFRKNALWKSYCNSRICLAS